MFEEAIQHLLASGDPPGWTVGPVRSIPLGSLDAGTLGWSATVVALSSTQPNPLPQPVGEILLFVLPQPTGKRGRPARPPLLESKWSEFAASALREGTPRLLALARTADPSLAGALELWMHRLLGHLLADVD